MATRDIQIKGNIDIESIIKLQCYNRICKHNFINTEGLANCNLKHITLDSNGKCEQQLIENLR